MAPVAKTSAVAPPAPREAPVEPAREPEPAPPVPVAVQPTYASPPEPAPAPPSAAPQTIYDPFRHAPPFRPRRNRQGRNTWIAAGLGGVMLAAVAALNIGGGERLRAALGLAVEASPLRVTETALGRRTLGTGLEVVEIRGTLENPTEEPQRVPPIRAELRDGEGRVVYTRIISPPAREIGPGSRLLFSDSTTEVPRAGTEIRLTPETP